MKSKLYLISITAFLAACSSPETDKSISEVAETVQGVAALETPESGNEATQTEKSSDDAEELTLRQVDAHVHGGATLAIAVDGKSVTAELETPLYNLLGFEHAPETAAQKEAVEATEKQLGEPSNLISFNEEAGCKAMPVVSKTELFDHDDHHEGDHEHHEKDDHDHHDEEKDHDHDDHKEGDDHDDHSDHQDVVISYSYTCEAPQNLSRLNADVLTAFPLMDELDVVYLAANSQATFELTPSTPTADLRP